jgi:hypothetical protein
VEAWIRRQLGRQMQREESLRIGEFEITALQTHATGLRRVRITRLLTEGVETPALTRE